VGDVAYTWDDRGNLTNDGTFTYTYASATLSTGDGAGRLVRAASVTNTLVYTYTATGLRVAQSVDGDVAEFAWDWASGLPEMLSESGNLYLAGHETLGKWDGANWSYTLPDALGSVRQVTDETGAVTATREWTPYGEELGGAQEGLGYTGEWQDAALGLTYLRARWYDAGAGRFARRDVWEGNPKQPQSLHLYVYVGDDPANRTDPTGHHWYDPINDRWVATDALYMEAPYHPRIEFYADTNPFLEREDVFALIVPRARMIEAYASQHGVPPELVAGILAVEMDDDTEQFDVETDHRARECLKLLHSITNDPGQLLESPGAAFEKGSMGCVCFGYVMGYANTPVGVGAAQIHINRPGWDWWAVVQHYRDQGYSTPAWADNPLGMLLSTPGAIEGTAMFGRALADGRTGINALHDREDLSLDDMGIIFVGYRYGVGGYTNVPDPKQVFPNISAFQATSPGDLTDRPRRSFDIARPYFDAFQFYFEYIGLYEAEYGR
jgi:RHS repeat-associated protein